MPSSEIVEQILGPGPTGHGPTLEHGGLAMVFGFEGDSGTEDSRRIHLTADLTSAYVDVPSSAVIEDREIATERSPWPGKCFWIPQDQNLTCWMSVPTQAEKLDAMLITEQARSSDGNGTVAGTERFDPMTAIAIGSAAWSGAIALGIDDDISAAANKVVTQIGKTVSGWLGW